MEHWGGVPNIRPLIPFMRAPPHDLITTQKAPPPPNTITLGIRISTSESGGRGTHDQSITGHSHDWLFPFWTVPSDWIESETSSSACLQGGHECHPDRSISETCFSN